MLKFIRKRDGRLVPFEEKKIGEAIQKAVRAVGGSDMNRASGIARQVVGILEVIYKDERIPTVENVQDLVEKILIENGHAQVAKAYILYRNQHESLRRTQEFMRESIESIDSYLAQEDWRVNENANMGYSLQGLNNHIASNITSNYWLNKIYPEYIAAPHRNADLHLHDLGMLSVYCCGWDLKEVLLKGFTGAYGKVQSGPPKHFRTALGQVVNFFYTLQGEAAGAQAFANFDTLLAPFIRYDGLGFTEVKQAMQEFIFNMNVPTRVGFQTPFTNVTMDMTPPSTLAGEGVIIGGRLTEATYGEFQEEMDLFNRAFCEVMMAGDASGRIFSFPIPTYNLTRELDWESTRFQPIWEMTAKYGIPYFSNFINSDMSPEDARSMCCRLRLDNRELRRRGGGLFGSNPLTGSIGVVTLNLPRAAYLADSKEAFFARIGELMDIARDSLEIKRKQLERFTEHGLYPYSRFYLDGIKERSGNFWDNHFSTIGLIGMNEACLNLLGRDITTPAGNALAVETLEFMRTKLEAYQEETGHLYNLEATPGEGTSFRLARADHERYPEILAAGHEQPYYTNSTQLPVGSTDDIFQALRHQDQLQTRYTGGTVFHGFLGERLDDWQSARLLARRIAENFHLPYFTITPTFTICPEHGYIAGEHFECPHSGHGQAA
ncbi:ribonucleoside-triphosphate reductase class III catalytic subunit [Geoalkalibacter ferrihydriticus]|uniref:Ribonucleoside-triphosphate reductase n=2 Tax=Geoalkalibacter ferrihydriticus TaxID=392333 RepID=A0A0C2DS76_9BACT|nr:ribonucleoside triphosphate reductase [Geoalkalibacter ferrihydriticus]KIH76309.1 ribonucleoside-triphosphate reductase [Geoalkalibacter ferrihydriticus DSM 17813]SDL21531.1 ribonucleoside-triphosphate reductase class III catalytic subunit [Geoalkalibacter ferrihydriticus]